MKHPATYISDHLLLSITLPFIAGIALCPLFTFSAFGISVLIASIILLFCALCTCHFFHQTNTALYLLIPLMLTIGCYIAHQQLQVPAAENHIYNRITKKTEVVLIGTMETMAGFDGRTSTTIIKASHLRHDDDPRLLPTSGKVFLRLQGPWPNQLSPGSTLAIRAQLKRPDSYKTPGVFNYAQYLARRGLWVTGFVKTPIYLEKVDQSHSAIHDLLSLPERIRDQIGKQIDVAVAPDRSGLYRAILIGDRTGVDDTILETFKGSGTTHILAISGLHMAVIGTLLYACFYWILRRSEKLLLTLSLKKWAALLSLPFLIFYGLLAGLNTPVFRALIMSSIVILSICTDRRKSPGPLLAFAALVILVIEPLQLFTVSFQLSFAAITGILFLFPLLTKLLFVKTEPQAAFSLKQSIRNWLLAGILVSTVATLATAPITLHAFNRFSITGPIANLLVEPLICLWSLPAGFLSIPFLFIQPEISTFLLQVGSWGLKFAVDCTTFFSSFPFSSIWLSTPSPLFISVFFGILVLFAIWGFKTRKRTLLCASALSITIFTFYYQPIGLLFSGDQPFRVSYLDIGQGSSTLLEYPTGYRVLVDGGGSSFSRATVGERIIAPFLWKKGIRKLDAIVITHPDADHYNGLEFVVDHFSPSIIWTRDKVGHDERFKDFIKQVEGQTGDAFIPTEGQRLGNDTDFLECIANLSHLTPHDGLHETRSLANSGLVVKGCSEKLCVLFPGDIGKDMERLLVAKGYSLDADVLLAAHHGSATSNSSELLEAVKPNHLIISAGHSTKNYFPHTSVVQECERQKINLFSTTRHGTVELVSEQNGYRIYGYGGQNNNPLYPFNSFLLAGNPSD